MAITLDGIFVDGQKATFRPEDILTGFTDTFYNFDYETGTILTPNVPDDPENPTRTEDYEGRYFIAKIRKIDDDGRPVKLKVGISDESIRYNSGATSMDTMTVRDFAVKKMATIAMTGGYIHYDKGAGSMLPWGAVIIDGNLYYNGTPYNIGTITPKTLAIMEDGSFRYYLTEGLDPLTLINDGVKYAVCGRYPIISNGVALVSSTPTIPNDPADMTRAIIAYDNDNYYFMVNDPVIFIDDCINVLLSKGIQEAYLLDGGGSTSLNLCTVKVNRNKDNGGKTDRKLGTFLYIAKPGSENNKGAMSVLAETTSAAVTSINANTSDGLQEIRMNGIASDILDVNDLPLNSVAYSYADTSDRTTINLPEGGGGYWFIFTFGLSKTLKTQLAIRATTGVGYIRGLSRGSATKWSKINQYSPEGALLTVTDGSTKNLADYGVVNEAGYYVVLISRAGYADNTSSAYFIHYLPDNETNGPFCARTVICEGTPASAPRLSSAGVVSANTSSATQTYLARAIKIYG